MEMADQRHPPLVSRVGPGRAAKEHRRFLDTLFANGELGQLGQRRSILRLLKEMFAQQPLGVAAITGV